jgi:CO/xanthine dehydrogenase FAD-binding subunit
VGFHEVSARYRDFARVAAGATVTVDEAGLCSAAELVLLRVAPTPYRVDVSHLVGTTIGESERAAVAESLAGIEPEDDIEVSGAYRKRVAVTLALRALHDAYGKASATA